MAIIDIKVPDIGDFADVGVIELLVKPGDSVEVDQSLMTVESDKASMEIPSSHAGVVMEIKGKLGDRVAEGSVIISMEVGAESTAQSAPPGDGAAALRACARAQRICCRARHPRVPTAAPPPALWRLRCGDD